jgi:uncharacterized protein (TIGR02145 family)
MKLFRYRLSPLLLFLMAAFLNGCGPEVVRDSDGNRYKTVQIGKQVWMKENLRTTRYNDGTPIPQVTDYEAWAGLESPAYCWYNNDSTQAVEYGALYNWYVVETDKLCPEGWHVPSDEEWNEMVSVIEDLTSIGGALKESGTTHWRNPNTGASNETGFTALPGGYRSYLGTFNLLRASGYWWSSTETNWYSVSGTEPTRVIFRSVQHDNAKLIRHISERTNGFSVRCVKNE